MSCVLHGLNSSNPTASLQLVIQSICSNEWLKGHAQVPDLQICLEGGGGARGGGEWTIRAGDGIIRTGSRTNRHVAACAAAFAAEPRLSMYLTVSFNLQVAIANWPPLHCYAQHEAHSPTRNQQLSSCMITIGHVNIRVDLVLSVQRAC